MYECSIIYLLAAVSPIETRVNISKNAWHERERKGAPDCDHKSNLAAATYTLDGSSAFAQKNSIT